MLGNCCDRPQIDRYHCPMVARLRRANVRSLCVQRTRSRRADCRRRGGSGFRICQPRRLSGDKEPQGLSAEQNQRTLAFGRGNDPRIRTCTSPGEVCPKTQCGRQDAPASRGSLSARNERRRGFWCGRGWRHSQRQAEPEADRPHDGLAGTHRMKSSGQASRSCSPSCAMPMASRCRHDCTRSA